MSKLIGKRGGILITTSLCIILAMAFYYLHTNKVKEDKVKRQAFKVMYRYASDLREKEDIYLDKHIYQSLKKQRSGNNNLKKERAESFKKTETNSSNYLIYYPTDIKYRVKLGSTQEKNIKPDTIYIGNESNSIFKDVFDNSLFTDFFVYDDSFKTIYTCKKEFDIQLKQKDKGFFSLDSVKFLKNNKSSLKLSVGDEKTEFGLSNSAEKQLEVVVGGEEYQVFIVPVNGIRLRYLVGLMPHHKYNAKKRALDRDLISAITIFVVLLILSVPLIKLLVVIPGEKFTTKSLTSLIISGAMVLFIIAYSSLSFTTGFKIRKNIQAEGKQLENFSDSIKQSFEIETDSMLNKLDNFSDWISNCKDASDDFNTISCHDTLLHNNLREYLNVRSNKLWHYAFISPRVRGRHGYGKTTFIVNNNKRYDSARASSEGVDISKRDYFLYPDKYQRGNHKFGFQSIYSYTDAKPQVVVSKKFNNEDSIVVCLEYEMYSVNKAIMPDGYSFCIIDKEGQVWFHKDTKNNVRENLFLETDDNPQLRAAVKSGRVKIFICDYKLEPHYLRVEPLDPYLGLFIVTMYKANDYLQVVNQSGYFTIASMLVVFFLWFIFWTLYMFYQYYFRKSDYEPHRLLFFFPNPKYEYKYIKLARLNFIFSVLLLLIGFLFYNVVYINHWVRLVAISGGALILWNIGAVRSAEYILSKKDHMLSFIAQLALFLISELFFISLQQYISVSLIISLTMLSGLNLVMYKLLNKSQYGCGENKQVYILKYYYYVASLIVSLIFVPLLVFYTTVYHEETTLYYTHQQRHVADSYIKKHTDLVNEIDGEGGEQIVKFLTEKGNYYKDFCQTDVCSDYEKGDTQNSIDSIKNKLNIQSTENYVNVFGNARTAMFYINNKIEDRGSIIKPNYFNSADSVYIYSLRKNKLILEVATAGTYNCPAKLNVEINKPHAWNMAGRYWGFIFVLIILPLSFISTLHLIGKYLFPYIRYPFPVFNEHNLTINKQGVRRYLVGFPSLVKEKLKKENINAEIFDLNEPLEIQRLKGFSNPNKDIFLLIDKVAFSSLDELTWLIEYLEKLFGNNGFNSISIVCFKVPAQWVEEINDYLNKMIIQQGNTGYYLPEGDYPNKSRSYPKVQINFSGNDKRVIKDSEQLSDIIILDSSIKRLNNLLSGFQVIFEPLSTNTIDRESLNGRVVSYFSDDWNWIDPENIGNVKNSLMTDSFYMGAEDNSRFNNKNELIFKAYTLNYMFYQKIWDSCTNEEKSALFDIADDNVINIHKDEVVDVLIHKGLVVKGQYMSLFNLSFTHYLRQKGNEIELINAELRKDKESGWSQYSLPIKLLAVSVIIFLVVTNQEFLTNIQSIIISVGAILTFAFRFFNVQSGNVLSKSNQ